MTGHVFVIQGDLRRFASDAYLHATDKELTAGGGWMTSAPDAPRRLDPALIEDFKSERRYTLPLADRPGVPNEPTTILTAVPYEGVKHEDEFVPRLEEFFRVGSEIAARRRVTDALYGRDRPLLGVPLFGTGGGGANLIRGSVFRMLYRESLKAAREYDIDVAIVLRNPRDYALAQMIRREGDDAWPELSDGLKTEVRRLGAIASRARLVPFMGSGISISAGAPTWRELIDDLAVAAGLESDVVEALRAHDMLDQAAYIQQEFKRRSEGQRSEFASSVIRRVDAMRYGLAPPLLAALEAEQAITLNYDRLFEWAAFDGQRPRRVIPGPATEEERWLLKLHGSVEEPESIVLTRDDYLGFNADRAALSSLVKATLMTRHLLFVGFGVKDPHFHEIVHDVRRAVPAGSHRFGTVLTLGNDDVLRKLWHGQLEFIQLSSPRELDIFLDAVLAFGASSHPYLLAEGYTSALGEEDRVVTAALKGMVNSIPADARRGAAWEAASVLLRDLGWNGTPRDQEQWRRLPEGLQ